MNAIIANLARALGLASLVLLFSTGCMGQGHRATTVGYIELDPDRYPALVEGIDKAVRPYSLQASESEDIDIVLDRKVLFLAYLSPDGDATALDVSDVKRRGRVEFRLYKDYFKSDDEFKVFAKLIVEIFAKFDSVTLETGEEYTK